MYETNRNGRLMARSWLTCVRTRPNCKSKLVTWDTQAELKKEMVPSFSEYRSLYKHVFLLAFDWSPDGKWLVNSEQYNAEGCRQAHVQAKEPAAGRHAEPTTARKIVTAQPNSDIWQGRMSPDGRWVVFERSQKCPKWI